jgi:nitronate monooxygenase
MASATTPEMVIAVSNAGGLGSLPSALYTEAQLRAALEAVRAGTSRPINVNFFCHAEAAHDPARQAAWQRRLAPYYVEAGLDPDMPITASGRAPFDDAFCTVVERYRPEVVSFHFGLPTPSLLDRVKRSGAKVISSATTVAEACWLEEHGIDAVIAMGSEAGGHRGTFLANDMTTQVGTLALVPLVADAVSIPVIAAGGIADRRGVEAALALGAAGVQVGTAYLLTPEAKISAAHRSALQSADNGTAITNLFTGRPARGIVNRIMAEIGPLSDLAPAFPTAGGALAPIRSVAEADGRADFTPFWAGQAFLLATSMSAAALTRSLGASSLSKSEVDSGGSQSGGR